MIIKCKSFFNVKTREFIKNCYLKWNKRRNSWQILNESESFDLMLDHLIPSFIDSHVHLFLSGNKEASIREKELSYSLEESLKVAEKNIKILMKHGIFSVIDAGDNKWCALTLRDMNNFKNFKIIASGKALFKKGRYGSFIGYEITDFNSLKSALKDLLKKKVDVIKVLNSGINSVKEYGKETDPQFSYREMDYIVKFSKDYEKDIIVHVNGYKAIKNTIKHDVTRLEHVFFIKDEALIKDIAQKGIKITPTFRAMYNLIENEYLSEDEKKIIKKTVENHKEEIKKFINFGGKILLGTDAGSYNVYHGESFYNELKFFVDNLNLELQEILSIICDPKSAVLLNFKELSLTEIIQKKFLTIYP